MNPFNLKPHSQKYKDIFKTRQGLPVHKQMGEFLEMFNSVSNLTLPPPAPANLPTRVTILDEAKTILLTSDFPTYSVSVHCHGRRDRIRKDYPVSQARPSLRSCTRPPPPLDPPADLFGLARPGSPNTLPTPTFPTSAGPVCRLPAPSRVVWRPCRSPSALPTRWTLALETRSATQFVSRTAPAQRPSSSESTTLPMRIVERMTLRLTV